MTTSLADFFLNHSLTKELGLSGPNCRELIQVIEQEYLFEFLFSIIVESEEILSIDPNLDRKDILEIAARNMVKDLHAEAATIRLFDSKSLKMLTYGAFGFSDFERLSSIPVKKSIAGKVVRNKKSIPVPNIMRNPLYQNKQIVAQKGYNSLLAIPLTIPSFIDPAVDISGSIQIYYRENNRRFSKLEIIRAEMLARRVSHVLAKKKILDLFKLNQRKEKIADKIFVKLSNHEGVKLKDFFILMIPELDELLQLQSCTLFTLSPDQKQIYLEASFPADKTYHAPGHMFTVSRHPYFQVAVQGDDKYQDRVNERIDRSYVLIKNPLKSKLTTPGLRKFVTKNQVHSVLLVPLKIGDSVRHVLKFYATDQKQYFSEEEIELLTFFGKEIVKASKLEFLSDLLHDIKNPAVAVAGLAARGRKLLDNEDINPVKAKLISYLDIVARETTRLQEMAVTLTGEGRDEAVDLVLVAQRRFLINREFIRETKRKNIETATRIELDNLLIYCPVYGLERVVDNLLNNATKAIPEKGGFLAIACYQEKDMACLEVRNTGELSSEQIEEIKRGEVKGRGLNIIHRFVKSHHGSMDIRTEKGDTIITIKFPLYEDV